MNKVPDLWIPEITASCDREISDLRGIPIAGEAGRELWVRHPVDYHSGGSSFSLPFNAPSP